MKSLWGKLSSILKRGGFALLYYPVSVFFAACLAFLSIWMIYAAPRTNLVLFYSFQWTFAFGAFLNMALCVIAKRTATKPVPFIIANTAAFLVSAGAFFAIYFSSGLVIPSDTISRIIAGIGISFLVFLFVPTLGSKKIQYNQMIFMTVKSFFITVVYSLVIMLGFFFVAFAVQSLLYKDMSGNVYSYIAILSALFGYVFFLGYFPEFKKEKEITETEIKTEIEKGTDERLEKALKQPRFAEILFQNIMIPILAALTLVLFIWAVQIVITRSWPEYNQTIAIFTTYSLVGIFLYFIVSSYNTLLVRLYKRIIPITTLVFLAFEAYPIISRISRYGMKPAEYGIVLLWLFAAVTSVLFLILPIVRNRIPSYVAIALIAVFVMPGIGASDLSFSMQAKRLENLLVRNEMLADGKIVAGSDVPSMDRQDITDATNYLFDQENRTAPDWVSTSLPNIYDFATVYGFAQEYYDGNKQGPANQTEYLYLHSEYTPVPLEDYQYYVSRNTLENSKNVSIKTTKGLYDLSWDYALADVKKGIATPNLTVKFKGKQVLSTDLSDYESRLTAKYPLNSVNSGKGELAVPVEDMIFVIKGEAVQVKLVFQTVTITKDSTGKLTFNFGVEGVYFKETN